MHYAIWPEGQPEDVFYTMSGFQSGWHLFKRRFKMTFMFSYARRMRRASCEPGFPIPTLAEKVLQEAGAISPPGGWPKYRREIDTAGMNVAEVRIQTYSVI